MKAYANGKKATEFNRGQIGMLYRMAKEGTIKVERWMMNDFYGYAEYYGYDDNTAVADYEAKVLNIIKAAEQNDTAKTQELIDALTDHEFKNLSLKWQAKVNREIVK